MADRGRTGALPSPKSQTYVDTVAPPEADDAEPSKLMVFGSEGAGVYENAAVGKCSVLVTDAR